MNSPDPDLLNQKYSINTKNSLLQFKTGKGDLTVVEIKNNQASAVISMQGAHILSWVPEGEEDVIWVSDDAKFEAGKSVRGGVPICWPWFGAHESEASYPAHGFARTVNWQVSNTQELATGETQITFMFDTDKLAEPMQKMWPAATTAEYIITIGKNLSLELITHNRSHQAITIGQALHTYFSVHDVSHVSVTGLENKTYLDKTDSFKQKQQTDPVTIKEEVDRVYLQTAEEVIIDDQQRAISIGKQGSESTVVWNPWEEVANKMGDLGKEGYLKMLCVESANAAEDVRTIEANESHRLVVCYSIQKK